MVPLSVAFSRAHLVAFAWASGLALLYCLFVLVSPTRSCDCEPGRERLRCKHCKATGRCYRLGASTVHRFYWSVLGHRRLERRREQLDGLLSRHNQKEDGS